jgi:hypothetical protein
LNFLIRIICKGGNSSSPAEAGDPVNAAVENLTNRAEYWMPRFRGA